VTFAEYLTKRVGKSLAICRATKANRERFGTCLSATGYEQLGRDYVRDYPVAAIRYWDTVPFAVQKELDRAAAAAISRARIKAARSLYGPRQEGNDHG
jgi:hypothetical protein